MDRSGWVWSLALTAYFIVLVVMGAYVFAAIWPVPADDGAAAHGWIQTTRVLGLDMTIPDDTRLILIVMIAGVLGSCVHGTTSLATYIGNGAFNANWTPWYLLRPFIGIVLALIFYLALRGGLLSTQSEAAQVSPFGVSALAAIVGMFSKQATDKLEELFTTLFKTEKGEGDDQRQDSLDQQAKT